MTALYIVFIASLCCIGLMLGMKLRKLRQGKLIPSTASLSIREPNLSAEHIARTGKTTLYYLRRSALNTAILVSKIGILISYRISVKLREKYPRLAAIFSPDRTPTASQSPFLHAITEYKIKIKRFKERMKEEQE